MANKAKPQAETCPRANGEATLEPQIPVFTRTSFADYTEKLDSFVKINRRPPAGHPFRLTFLINPVFFWLFKRIV